MTAPATVPDARILLLAPRYPRPDDPNRSGLVVYPALAAEALRLAGAQPEVLAFHETDRSRHGSCVENDIRVHRVNLGWVRGASRFMPNLIEGWRLAQAVARLERDGRYQAIEAPNMDGIAWAVVRRNSRAWVRMHSPQWAGFAETAGEGGVRDRFLRRLDGATIRRARHLITHSRFHADLMRAEYRIARRRIAIVPHGIPDPGVTGPDRVPGRILAIGPLWRRKGADTLLDAFRRVAGRFPEATLTLVGPQPDPRIASQLQRFTMALGREAWRIAPRGALPPERLDEEWRAASIVVVPSRYESFGLVAIEAMARGIPVIASDAGALPEVTGDAAERFRAGAADQLAEVLATVLGSPGRQRELGLAGRRRYAERFTLGQMGAGMLAAFMDRLSATEAGGV